jgi:hypothetical protein
MGHFFYSLARKAGGEAFAGSSQLKASWRVRRY